MLVRFLKRSLEKWLNWFQQESLYHRIFWGIIISISAWNILSIFLLTINRYFSDSISIGIETTFLQWNNTFPAVSFCLTKNRSSGSVTEFVNAENIQPSVSKSIYVKNLHDLLFTNPNNFHFKEDYCVGLNSTCGVDILRARKELLPGSCEVFMANVSFLGSTVENCGDIFQFHELEMGYCYLANNILDYKSFENLPLKFDISHKEKSLKINLRGGFIWKYEMYVHSPDDLPYFNSITYGAFSDPTVYRYNVEEYDNNPDVKEEPIQQRSCKFPNEKDVGSPWHYSFSTCMSYLRIKFELEQCNCTHFTSPKISQITTQVKEYVVSKNVCYPSCLEQQITLVGSNQIKGLDIVDTFYVEISVTNLPSVRYNRVVTQTYLDVVVDTEETGNNASNTAAGSIHPGIMLDEDLIKWGWPEDVWFHVHNYSSAHVYLRLEKGQHINSIPTNVIADAVQLVKANSIQGNKLNNIDVVYTMWENLKKTPDMEPGQVAYHDDKAVKMIRVEKRRNEAINRLNRTKTEDYPDLRVQREQRDALERQEQKAKARAQKDVERDVEKKRQQEEELRSYTSLLKSENMSTNHDNGNDSDDFW